MGQMMCSKATGDDAHLLSGKNVIFFKNSNNDERDETFAKQLVEVPSSALLWVEDCRNRMNDAIPLVVICSNIVFRINPDYLTHVLEKLKERKGVTVFLVDKMLFEETTIQAQFTNFATKNKKVSLVKDYGFEKNGVDTNEALKIASALTKAIAKKEQQNGIQPGQENQEGRARADRHDSNATYIPMDD